MYSYNGWEGIPEWNDSRLTTITVAGTNTRLRVLGGDVAVILQHVADRFNREVEPVQEPIVDDWGWSYRKTTGGGSLSCHASGTAIDLNADDHPYGTVASSNFTPAQIAACRRIVADSVIDGVPMLRWLEHSDPMHWELNRRSSGATPGRVARLASRLRGVVIANPLTSVKPTERTPQAIDWRPRTGELIRIVQECVGAGIDGDRGPQTMAKTKDKQKALGIPQDGLAGPAFVEAYLLSVGNLYRGKAGMPEPAVKFVQWIGDVTPDGDFGPRTEDSVKGMQVWAGLNPDGNVGKTTKRAITR